MSQTRPTARRRATGTAALLLVASALLPATALSATTVFRSVDANGNVVFSDQPPRAGESATPVEIREPMSFEGRTQPPGAAADETWDWDMRGDAGAGDGGSDAGVAYASLAIAAPLNDEGVRANDGTVTVVVAVEPALQSGHQVEVLLDGQPVAIAAATSITLTDLERGTHSLAARIVDPSGAILLSSAQSTFHVLRHAPLLAPNRPKPTPRGG